MLELTLRTVQTQCAWSSFSKTVGARALFTMLNPPACRKRCLYAGTDWLNLNCHSEGGERSVYIFFGPHTVIANDCEHLYIPPSPPPTRRHSVILYTYFLLACRYMNACSNIPSLSIRLCTRFFGPQTQWTLPRTFFGSPDHWTFLRTCTS